MPTATKAKASAAAPKTKKKTAAVKASETKKPSARASAKSEGSATETAVAKTTTRRKAKSTEPPRAKLYWGVFNQNLKRVAVFDFEAKKDAEKHVKQLSKAGSEHFLQRIKEAIE